MDPDMHLPSGGNLIDYWTRTDQSGFGLIAIPDSSEPVMVEWREFRLNPDDDDEPHYLATFRHGDAYLMAREKYDEIRVMPDGMRRHTLRYRDDDGVCASELVRLLRGGEALELSRVEHGAYKGLWYGEVYVENDLDEYYEEIACRMFLNLERNKLTLYRWRSREYYDDVMEPGA